MGNDVMGQPIGAAPSTPSHLRVATDLLRPCHGYANGCVCRSCEHRATNPPQRVTQRIRQPWEVLPLDRAA